MCGPSSTPSTPTRRSTSRATTTWGPSPRGTSGRLSACSRSLPGSADLALASPLFPSVTVTLPDGRRLVEQAPGAAASRPYVHALTVSGVTHPAPAPPVCSGAPQPRSPAGTWDLPWLPASVLQTGGTLRYTLSGAPDADWASSPAAHPPSFETDQLPAVGFSLPSGATTAAAGKR